MPWLILFEKEDLNSRAKISFSYIFAKIGLLRFRSGKSGLLFGYYDYLTSASKPLADRFIG